MSDRVVAVGRVVKGEVFGAAEVNGAVVVKKFSASFAKTCNKKPVIPQMERVRNGWRSNVRF